MAREGTPASAARRRPVPGGPQPVTVHQLKATLRGVRPPIWRRLEVQSSSTLGKLHAELQRVLSDPRHEEHAERREWLGHGFDPERFDLAATNRALTRAR